MLLAGILVSGVGLLFAWPFFAERLCWRALDRRITAVEAALPARALELDPLLSLHLERLGSLLESWQMIGGCGAGASTGAGAAKWIGRGTSGGLFNLQLVTSYMPLPKGTPYDSGYNLSVTAQLTRDIGNKWNVGVLVPYLYKYYRNYFDLTPNKDISNGGLGDVNLLGTRRFGEINDTSLTLSIGIPTGAWRARYKNDLLTQEKQLGNHRFNGALTLDHTFDELWGVIVAGGTIAHRGGENRYGNYRSPVGTVYGYAGYFVGPFMPSLGLGLTHFWEPDRDRGEDQAMKLTLLTAMAEVEWSSDYLAINLAFSLPLGFPEHSDRLSPTGYPHFALQPWIIALGFQVSPF